MGDEVTGREFEALADHAGAAYLRYSFTRGTEAEVRTLVAELALDPGTRVLDVGCGPGRHVRALAELGIPAVGLDLSAAFLAEAGPGPRIRADARSLPLADGCVDAVICLCQGGFGLLGGTGEDAALAEMARVLRPGGRLALTAFSSYFAVRYLEAGDRFDADQGVNHERTTVRDPRGTEAEFDLWTTCFTPRELRLMAAAAGLRVDALWSVAPGDYRARTPDLEHPEWLLLARRPGSGPSRMSRPPV